ncbi:MAG: hypothetical protein ABSH44_23685 [Bryobacteraceae bacterium]|jgi:hypothetical protein
MGLAFRSSAQTVDQYLTGLAMRYLEERAASVAKIRKPEEVRQRQAYIRKKVMAELGGLPEKTPLNPRITGTLERDGYRIQKLIYESLPKFYVTANIYVPARAAGPFPAMLGVAGHSNNGKAARAPNRSTQTGSAAANALCVDKIV